MNQKGYLIKLLKKYKKEEDVVIDSHAELRAKQRNADLDDVKHNLLNPSKRLSFANRLDAEDDGLEKFKCYFSYSKTQCQIYIIKTNKKVTVKTIIKLNKRWLAKESGKEWKNLKLTMI